MRLIDADELNEYIGRESLDTREKIFALVDRMPTLPNPCGKPCAFGRLHGEWIPCKDDNFCKCSECKQIVMIEERSNFCPNCGAKMRQLIHGCSFASEECKKNPCADCGVREGEASDKTPDNR